MRTKEKFQMNQKIPSEIETVISEDREVAKKFNNIFASIVPSLKLYPKILMKQRKGNDKESVLDYINNFRNHHSNKLIKSKK